MWIDIIMKDGTIFTMDVRQIIRDYDLSHICLNGTEHQQCIVNPCNVEWIDGTIDDSTNKEINATLEEIFNRSYKNNSIIPNCTSKGRDEG